MFKRFSRPLQALGVAAVLSVAALGVQAQAQPHGPGPGGPGPAGPGFGPGGPGGPGPAPMFLGGRLLKDVGASDAQRKQIREIFDAAHKDLKAQRDDGRKLHEQLEGLLTAPTVDANAVEQVRQQIAAQHDAASKRISQAMVEAAKVLTAEQRAKLAEELKKHKARMEKRLEHMKEHGGKGGRGGPGGPGGPGAPHDGGPHGDHDGDHDEDAPPPPKGQ
ncbi:protein refolding chaperone Spy/CpxP family [Roseateles sp. YR242]|uniref:Spy/CpxP family protein refolding chaperone n=1 Tax=Roseateles sp. YR242 TaxID=1855305 RepID=UPI0008AC0E4C|nr:Spy/CpxP family protein refolding chaperone [Roseateles sp. YR242]SEK27890.1 protein refolding chaperone Spy/CpxP family [Roseateles sp. YR242]